MNQLNTYRVGTGTSISACDSPTRSQCDFLEIPFQDLISSNNRERHLKVIGSRLRIGGSLIVDVPKESFHLAIGALSRYLLGFVRVEAIPTDDESVALVYKKQQNLKADLRTLETLGRIYTSSPKPYGAIFYSDDNYRPNLLAAMGSYINFNPGHQIFFFDGIRDPILTRRLMELQITILDPQRIESDLGYRFTQDLAKAHPLHLAVARKLLARLIAIEGSYCASLRAVLLADSDVLFHSSTNPAFEELLSSKAGIAACVDWMETPSKADVKYDDGPNSAHRASIGGFFKQYIDGGLDTVESLLKCKIDLSPEELDRTPYFNSGIMFLRRSEEMALALRMSLDAIQQRPEEYVQIYPWPEQTLLNAACLVAGVDICWLEPTIWNFRGPKNKITHLFGSGGRRLYGYTDHRERVEAAWGLMGEEDFHLQGDGKKEVFESSVPQDLDIPFAGRDQEVVFAWGGEFGWEITRAVPIVNFLAQRYDKVTVFTFEDTLPLYKDLPVEVRSHGLVDRRAVGFDGEVIIPDEYQHCLKFIFKDNERRDRNSHKMVLKRSVKPIREDIDPPKESLVLIHARKATMGSEKTRNWSSHYNPIVDYLISFGLKVIFIGSRDGSIACSKEGEDCRGVSLEETIQLVKKSRFVLGPVSGPIHLAHWCGTPVFTWGCKDDRCIPGSPLGRVWNPFETPHYHPWSGESELPPRRYFQMDYKPKWEELVSGLDFLLKTEGLYRGEG